MKKKRLFEGAAAVNREDLLGRCYCMAVHPVRIETEHAQAVNRQLTGQMRQPLSTRYLYDRYTLQMEGYYGPL